MKFGDVDFEEKQERGEGLRTEEKIKPCQIRSTQGHETGPSASRSTCVVNANV
jgi:hypothetical protein